MEKDVPGQHAALMRTMIGIKDEFGPLPEEVSAQYQLLRRLSDRLGDPVTNSDLKWLIYNLGYGHTFHGEDVRSIPDLWRSRQIEVDDTVLVDWRKEEVEAVFKGVTGDGRVLVVINGVERKLAVDKVRVTELAVA